MGENRQQNVICSGCLPGLCLGFFTKVLGPRISSEQGRGSTQIGSPHPPDTNSLQNCDGYKIYSFANHCKQHRDSKVGLRIILKGN